ncbi:MAG: hypothetical protein H6509_03885 [Bryobacterales bacterium]|nr:hypothetical protein [Acidobacteriota bacterium]MCB9383732.1 hypothetical protein [Bryobacterales bacterium]
MKPFEHELKAVLTRREPSEDFTARVMAAVAAEAGAASKVAEMPVRRKRPAAFRWAAVGAVAASLTAGFFAIRHQRAERLAAEQAEIQLMESLSLAGSKISLARDRALGAPRGD